MKQAKNACFQQNTGKVERVITNGADGKGQWGLRHLERKN